MDTFEVLGEQFARRGSSGTDATLAAPLRDLPEQGTHLRSRISTLTLVHRRFEQNTWPSGRVDTQGGARPRDHSEIFRSMYALEHRDTNDARALQLVIGETRGNPGLKSVVVITDGISSDPAELRHLVNDLDRRNHAPPLTEQLRILAFGVGVVREEIEAAYARQSNGRAGRSCLGVVVREVSELPQLIGQAVAEPLRGA